MEELVDILLSQEAEVLRAVPTVGCVLFGLGYVFSVNGEDWTRLSC